MDDIVLLGGSGGKGGKGLECYRWEGVGSHMTPVWKCRFKKYLAAVNGNKGENGKQWQGI